MSDPRPAPHVFVLFGATGDLAGRKLFPGLYNLAADGRLPESYAVIGTSRHSAGSDAAFRDHVREGLAESVDDLDDVASSLLDRLTHVVSSDDDLDDLCRAVQQAEARLGDDGMVERLLYLSLPPSAMEPMVDALGDAGLFERARVVIEKPFGTDLATSRRLGAALQRHLEETQVFRIDHFLGKEAVQNLLALRFGNQIIEAVWSAEHVEQVQIDVPETLELEGRASFYEATGAFRDMISTHLCQLLGFVAMERPDRIDADAVRDAKSAVFAAMRPFEPADVVRGQYEGYTDTDGVDADSQTETFVAIRAYVDNDRWRGVPFCLRTGKAMAQTRRTITVTFKDPDLSLFDNVDDDARDTARTDIVLELTDEPEITVDVRAKRPGPVLDLATAHLHAEFAEEFAQDDPLEAYERLLLDVMHGDQTLFTRDDEVDRLWQLCDPIITDPPGLQPYEQGSWGPEAAQQMPGPIGWRIQR